MKKEVEVTNEKIREDLVESAVSSTVKRKKLKSKPPTYRRSEFSQATIDVYTEVPRLMLERGRKMSKNPSSRSVSGECKKTTPVDSRDNSRDNSIDSSQPQTTRT